MACSSSEEELPKTEGTTTFDKSYYLSFRDNLEEDLYNIGDKIRENGAFFSDTEEVRKIMEEVYEPNSLCLNAFNKTTVQVGSASGLKMEVAVEEPTTPCVSLSLYAKIQEINELLDKSNSAAEYVEVLENLFNEAYEGDLSPVEKNIILHLIVSQQVSADFIKNNPVLFKKGLCLVESSVKSSTSNWDYWGRCLTAAAGTATVTTSNIQYTESGNIIRTYTSQAINCNAGFGYPSFSGGGGDILSHFDDVGPKLYPEPQPICETCGRIYVEVCQ